MRGKFIVLEGGEGAGKSTIASFLKHSLPEKEILVTRAGGSVFGEKLRTLFVSDDAGKASPESRFALAFAAQADHIGKVIAPALAAGKHIVSDRLDASIFAYQVYAENELRLAPLFWKTRQDLFGGVTPDLYMYLEVKTEEGFSRVKKENRQFDHFEKRPIEFHERVREGYREFLTQVPHVVIDANRPIKSVQRDVLGIVKKYAQW